MTSGEKDPAKTVKKMVMPKIQKDLNFTCPECLAFYRLVEIHQAKQKNCSHNCLAQWKFLLHSHYQEQIILHLAQQEAQKEVQKEKDHE